MLIYDHTSITIFTEVTMPGEKLPPYVSSDEMATGAAGGAPSQHTPVHPQR